MKANWSTTEITAIRLLPGDDLKARLKKFATDNELDAAVIVSAVGSLSKVYLRLANQNEWACFDGKHEIVSLAGTLSRHGAHLHMSVSNEDGTTVGGHVVAGSLIYTTAEIVVARLDSLVFRRKACPLSGFEELVVELRTEEH